MIETVLHAQVRVANFLSKEEMHKLCVQDVAQLRIYINELMHTVIHALCGFAAWVVLMVTSWELGLVNLGVCLAAICTISVLDAFLVSKRTEENSDSGEFHGIWEDIHAGKKDGEAEVSAMVARVRHEETHDLGVLTSAGGALNTLVYATPVIVLFTGGVLVKEGRLPEHEIAYCFFYSLLVLASLEGLLRSQANAMDALGSALRVFTFVHSLEKAMAKRGAEVPLMKISQKRFSRSVVGALVLTVALAAAGILALVLGTDSGSVRCGRALVKCSSSAQPGVVANLAIPQKFDWHSGCAFEVLEAEVLSSCATAMSKTATYGGAATISVEYTTWDDFVRVVSGTFQTAPSAMAKKRSGAIAKEEGATASRRRFQDATIITVPFSGGDRPGNRPGDKRTPELRRQRDGGPGAGRGGPGAERPDAHHRQRRRDGRAQHDDEHHQRGVGPDVERRPAVPRRLPRPQPQSRRGRRWFHHPEAVAGRDGGRRRHFQRDRHPGHRPGDALRHAPLDVDVRGQLLRGQRRL